MLDGLEALIQLEKLGTVSEAAVCLRLTQSAVSKRIQALESSLGYRLVEADGRRLRLTPAAVALLFRAGPLVAELRSLKNPLAGAGPRRFSIGLSDSIASSWGPGLLRRALARAEGLLLDIHVHRSVLVLERLKQGHYGLGLVAGAPAASELACACLGREAMVLAGRRPRPGPPPRVLTIETASATWGEIGGQVLAHPQLRGAEFVFVESFAAAAQMGRAGYGVALVPWGTATTLRFRAADVALLSPPVSRQIQFVARKSLFSQPAVQALRSALGEAVPGLVSPPPAIRGRAVAAGTGF